MQDGCVPMAASALNNDNLRLYILLFLSGMEAVSELHFVCLFIIRLLINNYLFSYLKLGGNACSYGCCSKQRKRKTVRFFILIFFLHL